MLDHKLIILDIKGNSEIWLTYRWYQERTRIGDLWGIWGQLSGHLVKGYTLVEYEPSQNTGFPEALTGRELAEIQKCTDDI